MHFRQCHRRRLSGPVPAHSKAQEQQLYRDPGFGSSYVPGLPMSNTTPMQVPMSPPPPYDDRYLQPPFGLPGYGTPFVSQSSLPVVYAGGYPSPSSSWSSTSTLDLPRPRTSGGRQEQGGQRVPIQRPTTSGNNGCAMARSMNQGAALCDRLAGRMNDMLSGPAAEPVPSDPVETFMRESMFVDDEEFFDTGPRHPSKAEQVNRDEQRSRGIINYKKTWMYRNSRLPPGMVPCKMYIPTWTLACRAAKASLDVYTMPPKGQRDHYTKADPGIGTKATIIKSQTVDDKKLLVVAIQGTQWTWKMVDWAVNFSARPTAPTGFLDDEGNACHAGFLEVARAMVSSVAAQLVSTIEDEPAWATSSLLFTGHSAGGAVASLLYAHMLAETIDSDLTVLAGVFKRIHCITFGTPPVSLLPLQKPRGSAFAKDVFLSFVNEGDIVVRADRAYIVSLVKLYAAPPPSPVTRPRLAGKMSRVNLRDSKGGPVPTAGPPIWPVPNTTLSNPGRMVLLRQKPRNGDKIEAVQISDGELRNVVFGDRAMHSMVLYKRRIDDLAFAAVSGRDDG